MLYLFDAVVEQERILFQVGPCGSYQGNGHIEDESELLCLDMEHILEYVYNERAKKNGQIVHGHNECQCKRHFFRNSRAGRFVVSYRLYDTICLLYTSDAADE